MQDYFDVSKGAPNFLDSRLSHVIICDYEKDADA